MKKTLIYFLISTILISCSTLESKELKLNNTIAETFNESEIKDLQILFDFFNEQICGSKDMNNDSLTECYENYCSQIKKEFKSKYTFDTKIDFNQQLEIYEQLDTSTFKQIWYFGRHRIIRKQKDTLDFKEISLASNKKYSKFLEKYGEENNTIKNYIKRLKAAGDITPTMNSSLIMAYERYNLSDIRTKLMIAIHYLTINDQFFRQEKY